MTGILDPPVHKTQMNVRVPSELLVQVRRHCRGLGCSIESYVTELLELDQKGSNALLGKYTATRERAKTARPEPTPAAKTWNHQPRGKCIRCGRRRVLAETQVCQPCTDGQ